MHREIYLCGLIHLDPKGPQRLNKILTDIQPETIVLETSEPVAQYVVTRHAQIESLSDYEIIKLFTAQMPAELPAFNKDSVIKLMKVSGYEFVIAMDYSKKTGCKILFGEDPKLQMQMMTDSYAQAGIAQLGLVMHSPNIVQQVVDEIYRLEIMPDNINKDVRVVERNYKQVELMQKATGKILTLNGLLHVYDYKKFYNPTLFELFAKENPIRLKLSYADKLTQTKTD